MYNPNNNVLNMFVLNSDIYECLFFILIIVVIILIKYLVSDGVQSIKLCRLFNVTVNVIGIAAC